MTGDSRQEAIQAVVRYFETAMPGRISTSETPSGSVDVIIQTAPDTSYSAQLAREFLEEHSAAEIEQLLREWNLASEMRRLEGMPVSVSSAGVRLESSN